MSYHYYLSLCYSAAQNKGEEFHNICEEFQNTREEHSFMAGVVGNGVSGS